MTRVNLLPWRERLRERRQRDFLSLLGVVVAGVLLLLVGVHVLITNLIDGQETRNQYLRNEIARLNRVEQEIRDMRQAETQLLDRLDAIRRLQRSRPDMVRAFDALVRLTPEDVFLTSLTARSTSFNLRGNARINNVVSDYMRELAQSAMFGEPRLKVIETRRLTGDIPVSAFDLDVAHTPPVDAATE